MACVGSAFAGLRHRPACLVPGAGPKQFRPRRRPPACLCPGAGPRLARRRVSPPDDGPAGYAPRVATPGRDAVSADVFGLSAVCFNIPRMLMLSMLLVHCEYGNTIFIILS